MIIRPLLHLLEIPAHMMTLVIRPEALFPLPRVEGKHIDVREAHQVHTQDLDAMI